MANRRAKTYEQALAEGKKVGVSKARGDAHLAQTAWTLCQLHRGANPKMIYDGAIKRRLTPLDLIKLAKDPVVFSDLMFE